MNPEIKRRPMNQYLLRGAALGLLYLFSKDVTVSGREFLPRNGPAIIVSNHTGTLEGVVPFAYLPETPAVFTKAENFKIPVLGSVLERIGAIGVDRGEADKKALRETIRVLTDQRGFVFTCPEGTRGRDRDGDRTRLKPAKSGVIFVAQLAANRLQQPIPISPWAIWGTEGVLPEVDQSNLTPKERFKVQRGHTNIAVGKPYLIYPSDQRVTSEDRQVQIDVVMRQIRDMLPEKYHGFYSRK